MKKMAKWKKVIFSFTIIIVLLRIFYICLGGEVNKNYYVSQQIDTSDAVEVSCKNITARFFSDQKRLNSVEMIFSGIVDPMGEIVFKITSEEDLIYQTNISLANINNFEWKQIFINAELEREEYYIHLEASDNCVQVPNVLVVSRENAAPETIVTYNGETEINGQLAVQYGFLQPPGWLDRAITSSLWIIFLLITWIFLYNFERISRFVNCTFESIYAKTDKQIVAVIAEMFCCLIIVNCSGITFQEPTKILLYFISLCAGVRLEDRRTAIGELYNTPAKKIFICFLYIYAAFSLVGQRIFVYPLDLKFTPGGGFVFLIAVLWFVPIIQTVFYLLEKLSNSSFAEQHSLKRVSFILIMVLILLLPAAYNLFANNPGISTYDSGLTMSEKAHRLYGYDDWHPFFYSAVLRVILEIWDSTYAVIIAQYIFWVYVMLEFFFYLREKKMKDSILIFIALFTGLNAANILHLNSIWKDIPYAISLFWVLVLLAKLSMDFKKYQKRWYIYLELLMALTGIFFYRKNGIVPFVVVTLMMVIILRRNIKIWCTLAATMLVIVVIKGPVYSHFGVTSTGNVGMYIGLSQEILGVYYAGGEVSEETLRMINTMTANNVGEYRFNFTYSNSAYELYVEPQEFIGSYIDTFIKNPILTVRALANRADVIWDIYVGEGCGVNLVNFHGTIPYGSFYWNDYYPERTYVSLYDTMAAATKYTASSQWISAIEWRCGFFTLLGLIAIVYLLIKRGGGKYILIITPIVGQILSLLLSTGWADFRYFWPLNLMNMGVLLLTLAIGHDCIDAKGENGTAIELY